jgi:hypothetical protein
LRALKTPGLPLDVNAQLVFSTPVNDSTLSLAKTALLALVPASAPAGGSRLAALEKLAVRGSLKLPAVATECGTLAALNAETFTLKGLKLAVPALTADTCGARITFNDAEYDFSQAREVEANGLPSLAGIAHSQCLTANGLDLAALFACGKPAKGFAFGGRVDAYGKLNGIDFAANSRLSWQGAVKFKLSDLAVHPPRDAASAGSWLERLGGEFSAATTRVLKSGTVELHSLSQSLPVEDSQKCANGLMLALRAYLWAFGLEAQELEFEALEPPTVEIRNGFAVLSPLQLRGKGNSAGLELSIRNLKMNLVDESFADDNGEGVCIFPADLPAAATEHLRLNNWPVEARNVFLQALQQGKLPPLRIRGQLRAPVLKLPWAELRSLALRALFDADQIADAEALARARRHLAQAWGANLDAAADLAGRFNLDLAAWLECIPGLPPNLAQLRDLNLREALQRLAIETEQSVPSGSPKSK